MEVDLRGQIWPPKFVGCPSWCGASSWLALASVLASFLPLAPPPSPSSLLFSSCSIAAALPLAERDRLSSGAIEAGRVGRGQISRGQKDASQTGERVDAKLRRWRRTHRLSRHCCGGGRGCCGVERRQVRRPSVCGRPGRPPLSRRRRRRRREEQVERQEQGRYYVHFFKSSLYSAQFKLLFCCAPLNTQELFKMSVILFAA